MSGSSWQREDGECLAVLRCVFTRVSAEALWRCGAVSRAWRRAAADEALWRRALRLRATPPLMRAFTAAMRRDEATRNSGAWSWRREYELSAGRWARRSAWPTRGPLVAAALDARSRRLALLAEDASVSIWECEGGEWVERWAGGEHARGWSRGGAARWGPGGARLLLGGPLALCDRWELVVLQPREDGSWRVVCRADAGASGGACWAGGGGAFLSLRPQLLAPALALSTVWLNAVSQETTSEYTGVTTPLLRIFNESVAHITHMVMTEMPSVPIDVSPEDEVDPVDEAGGGAAHTHCEPRPEYYAAISAVTDPQENADRILVVAMGAPGGARGEASALAAWRVRAAALTPPPLLAGAGLAERVRRRRQQRAAPHPPPPPHEPHDAPPPSEAAVRALCTPPDDLCPLGERVLGMVLHPRGSCIWATTTRSAWCVTLPTLRRVMRLRLAATASPAAPALPHYIAPDVDDDYFVTPTGGGSGEVQLYACRSGRRGATLRHAAPAIAALVVPTAGSSPCEPATVLVLTTDGVQPSSFPPRPTGRRRCRITDTPTHTGMAAHHQISPLRHLARLKGWSVRRASGPPPRSCSDAAPPPCPPCAAAAPPPCRATEPHCRPGLRVTCCAPRRTARPPPVCPHRPLTCQDARAPNKKSTPPLDCFSENVEAGSETCGAQLDRVARRLAMAAAARRADYEQEAAAAAPAPAPSPAPYRLAQERECVRATDGCDYTVAPAAQAAQAASTAGIARQQRRPSCGPEGQAPPPQPISLFPTDACEIKRSQHIDPCAHRPRIVLEIDRSSREEVSSEKRTHIQQTSSASAAESASPKRPSSRERLTARIMESLNLRRENKSRPPKSSARSTETEFPRWCAKPPKPVDAAGRCVEPSIVEQLRRRPGGTLGRRCDGHGNNCRQIHTSSSSSSKGKCKGTENLPTARDQSKKSQVQGVEAVLREREEHKEIARGRVVSPECAADGARGRPGAGRLELRIPPASEAIRVRVSLDFVPQTVNCLSPSVISSAEDPQRSQRTLSRSLSSVSADSWLSIRGIQKKFSGYKSGKNEKSSTEIKSDERAGCPNNTSPPQPKVGLPNVCNPSNNSNKPTNPDKPSNPCGCPPSNDARRCSSVAMLQTIVF